MRAGQLRDRVTIQRLDGTRDALGAENQTWIDQLTFWASVEQLEGRELLSAQHIQADITTRITTRFFELPSNIVTSKMRLKFGARLYDILSVINSSFRDREIEFMCKERI